MGPKSNARAQKDFFSFYGALTKVLDTGPKGKAPRGDHPMVKKRITQDQLHQGCQTVQFVDKIWKIGHFQSVWPPKNKEFGHFENLVTLRIWSVLAIFLTFAPTNNSIKLGNFSQFFGPFLPKFQVTRKLRHMVFT